LRRALQQSVILRKINTAFRMPPRKWGLLFRVLGLSLQAWYLDRYNHQVFKPESRLKMDLREPDSDADILKVRDIAWAIRSVAKITPWLNVCRHQAWQASVLLSESGLKFVYFIGAKKNDSGAMDGHSWIISANRFVSGRCNVRDYHIIKQFQ
jgi:hypothetical protein